MNLEPTNYNLIAAQYAQHRRTHPGVLESLVKAGSWLRHRELQCGHIGTSAMHLHGIDPSDSALPMISEASFQAGITRMENDLQAEPIAACALYTML